jgi:hypothetical protein
MPGVMALLPVSAILLAAFAPLRVTNLERYSQRTGAALFTPRSFAFK